VEKIVGDVGEKYVVKWEGWGVEANSEIEKSQLPADCDVVRAWEASRV